MHDRQRLQQLAARTDARSIAEAVDMAKRGEREGRLRLCACTAWVAYACPDATQAVWDNIASRWLGTGPTPEVPANLPEAPLEATFWKAFWDVVDGFDQGYDAISITVAVAALGAAVHPDFGEIANAHAQRHPGAVNAIKNPVPGYTDVEALGACPEGSLGRSLYVMMVENGYDPEVLDRNAIALAELPHALQYLNTRILQMHDVWHLTAGYETTSSHEIAISAFQLAQFGHNYSSMFLAAVLTISTFKEPRGFTILMQIMAEAWQHGRATPWMMDVPWEQEWNTQLAEIRAKYSIPTYRSIFPDDLLEAVETASIWRKLRLGFQLVRYNRRLRQPLAA